ncbi:MAG: hypothetical protein ACQEXJ_21765 [Myxococcota bacterium]
MGRFMGMVVVVGTLAGCVAGFSDLPAERRAAFCRTLEAPSGLAFRASPAVAKALRAQLSPSMGDIGDLALHMAFEGTVAADGTLEDVDDLTADVPWGMTDRDAVLEGLEQALEGSRISGEVGQRFRTRFAVSVSPEGAASIGLAGDRRCQGR